MLFLLLGLVPLMDVVGTHCKLMCHEFKPHVKQWLMLVNSHKNDDSKQTLDNSSKSQEKSSSKEGGGGDDDDVPDEKQVPLLLRDPIAVLLLLIVNLPQKCDKSVYTHVIASVFNMVYIQAVLDLCRVFDEEERVIWASPTKTSHSSNDLERWLTIKDYVSNVINYFQTTPTGLKIFEQYTSDRDSNESKSSELNYKINTIWTNESARNFVEQKCLHFMKIASLLKSYVYNQEVASSQLNSYDYLASYLSLNDTNSRQISSEIVSYWLNDLSKAYESHVEQVSSLLSLSLCCYHAPELLQLPYLYSDLFSYYLNKKCQFCSRVPKETGICLLCGAQVCYKTNYCCDQMRDFNKKHVNACGAGTFILINVNSTYVIVIRGKRCAPWASLYLGTHAPKKGFLFFFIVIYSFICLFLFFGKLDEHGEEDRDLR